MLAAASRRSSRDRGVKLYEGCAHAGSVVAAHEHLQEVAAIAGARAKRADGSRSLVKSALNVALHGA